MRAVTFFSVGNGNCCLLEIDDYRLVFDLKGGEGWTSWEMIRRFLPWDDGRRKLDVLCISHGDQDHCGGFVDFAQELLDNRLVIGTIWHPNYDRTKVDDTVDLPEDYLSLHQEILRRQALTDRAFGNLEVPLTAWDDETRAFEGIHPIEDLRLRVLSPYVKDC
jgi:beta-lactamase superfamily II metal-dependent hydrolase